MIWLETRKLCFPNACDKCLYIKDHAVTNTIIYSTAKEVTFLYMVLFCLQWFFDKFVGHSKHLSLLCFLKAHVFKSRSENS